MIHQAMDQLAAAIELGGVVKILDIEINDANQAFE